MSRRSPEPLVWLLFSSGGMATALLVPVLLVLFGLAFPLGWLSAPDHAHLLTLVGNPITKLVLFGLRAGAVPLGAPVPLQALRRSQAQASETLIIVVCYGAALAGSAVAAVVLLTA